jgi:hypothetical protein
LTGSWKPISKNNRKQWINELFKSVEVHEKLTYERDESGIKRGQEYAISDNKIAKTCG